MTSSSLHPGMAVVILSAASLTVMANAVISPALPEIRAHFEDMPGITTLTGLLMTLPSLSVALAAALAGWCADRYGKRLVLTVSLLIYAISGSSGWWASGMTELLTGRIVLGLGVAGVMAVSMTLAADFFQGEARQKFMGVMGAAQSLGGVLFLLAGGWLAAQSWRHPFLLYLLALGVLMMAVVAWQKPPSAEVSVSGTTRGSFPWAAAWPVFLTALFAMLAFYLIPTKLPFRLREIGVDSSVVAGAAVAAGTVTGAFTSLTFSRLRRYASTAQLLAVSFLLMAVGYALIGCFAQLVVILAGSAIAGLGVGMIMPNLMDWLFAEMPAEARGQASGLLTAAIFFGQFLSPVVAGPLASGTTLPYTFLIFAVILGCAALFFAFQRKAQGKS
jgi:MFS family permease